MTSEEAKQALKENPDEDRQIIIDFCKEEISVLELIYPELNSSEDMAEASGKIDSLLMVINFIKKDMI